MSEIKSLKPMQRVKILAPPKEPPHPLQNQIGHVVGVNRVRKNSAGSIIFKSYDIRFGHSSVREVESGCLWPMEG